MYVWHCIYCTTSCPDVCLASVETALTFNFNGYVWHCIYCSTVHLALTACVRSYDHVPRWCACVSLWMHLLLHLGLRVVCSLVNHLLCLYHFKVVHVSRTLWGRCSHHLGVVFGSPVCVLQCVASFVSLLQICTCCLCPNIKAMVFIATVSFDP